VNNFKQIFEGWYDAKTRKIPKKFVWRTFWVLKITNMVMAQNLLGKQPIRFIIFEINY
jgi:hypothetical protein